MIIGNDIENKELLEIGHFIEHLFSLYTSTKYPVKIEIFFISKI